jgi:glycine cleavage system aminomethyltransferase T
VHLQLTELVEAPASVYQAERGVGTLTSSAAAPDGEVFALAVIKTPLARPGQQLEVGDARIDAAIIALAGSQPATLKSEDPARI